MFLKSRWYSNRVNSAVTLARSLTQSFAGIRPANVTGFVFAQLVGALAALPVTSMLISNQAPIDEKP